MVQPTPAGHVCHTEIVSRDIEATRAFFARAFQWTYQDVAGPDGEPYLQWRVAGKPGGGITGPIQPSDGAGTLNYLAVASVDQSVAAIRDAGGTIIQPAMDVGSFGRFAVFREPGGAVLAVWQAPCPEPTGLASNTRKTNHPS